MKSAVTKLLQSKEPKSKHALFVFGVLDRMPELQTSLLHLPWIFSLLPIDYGPRTQSVCQPHFTGSCSTSYRLRIRGTRLLSFGAGSVDIDTLRREQGRFSLRHGKFDVSP